MKARLSSEATGEIHLTLEAENPIDAAGLRQLAQGVGLGGEQPPGITWEPLEDESGVGLRIRTQPLDDEIQECGLESDEIEEKEDIKNYMGTALEELRRTSEESGRMEDAAFYADEQKGREREAKPYTADADRQVNREAVKEAFSGPEIGGEKTMKGTIAKLERYKAEHLCSPEPNQEAVQKIDDLIERYREVDKILDEAADICLSDQEEGTAFDLRKWDRVRNRLCVDCGEDLEVGGAPLGETRCGACRAFHHES